LTPNVSGTAYALFNANATYSSPVGADLRLSYRVTSWLLLGIAGGVSKGDVTVSVSGDTEGGASASFAGESLGQSQIEGRADVVVPRWSFWRDRLTPYAMFSAGVLRHWHGDNALIESGSVIQGGGGLRYGLFTRAGPKVRTFRMGAAAEVRVTRVSGGFHWGREHRTTPSARLELFAGWGR
jgi:hypothetical protein